MRIKAITNARHDRVWVVGSGPSMRLMPPSFLEWLGDNEPVIALNQAWRYWVGLRIGPLWTLTVHPELLVDYLKLPEGQRALTEWVVKRKPPLNLSLDARDHWVFDTSPDWDTLVKRPADTLFIGRGVQQTAMDLAARMGAKTIILIGVDMCALGDEHHGHVQHVQFHGVAPSAVYDEYFDWTEKARRILYEAHGVHVLSLNPFLGAAGGYGLQYRRLCRERGLAPLPSPEDVSTYSRKGTDAP